MDAWVVWMIVALVLGVAEVVTGGSLVLLMLGGGALAGSATAALTDNEFLPWVSFAVVSLGLLGLVRPVARKHMNAPMALRTGAERLVGEEAVVIAEVTDRDGRVKLGGEVWSARAFGDGETFEPGTRVRVLEIDGATALVA